MTEYTPKLEKVRDLYVRITRDAFVASTGEIEAEFDRAIAAHDREVAAAAWDKGRASAIADHRPPLTGFDARENPYREGDHVVE